MGSLGSSAPYNKAGPTLIPKPKSSPKLLTGLKTTPMATTKDTGRTNHKAVEFT